MDITTLAAWGEFIGGVAVVASLLYLAFQIRQNSRLLRASTTAASSEVEIAIHAMMAQEPDVPRSFRAGLAERDSQSEEDRERFDAIVAMWFQVLRQQYQFQQDGIGSADEWTYRSNGMTWMFRQGSGTRQWWRDRKGVYPAAFREVIEDMIREAESST